MKKKTSNKKVKKVVEKKIEGVVSFSQVAKLSGISITRLRSAAHRKGCDVFVATDNYQGVDLESLPGVLEEAKKRKERKGFSDAVKIEALKKDEVWFSDLAEELKLSKKQLANRCSQSNIEVFNRVPELVFGTHFARALKAKDANFLREAFQPVDLKAVEKIIKALCNDHLGLLPNPPSLTLIGAGFNNAGGAPGDKGTSG